MVMVAMMMAIPIVVIAMVAISRIDIPVMARLDQHVATVVMMIVMPRHDDHFVMMAVMPVMMAMAGFDNDRLRTGGADEEQCRYSGEQNFLHFTFS